MASTTVNQEYMKDPITGNRVSPITDISTIGLPNGQFYSSNYFDYRRTVFAAHKENISLDRLENFVPLTFAGWTVDIGSENLSNNYFVDKEVNNSNLSSALYEIYISVKGTDLQGTHHTRELFASIRVNDVDMYSTLSSDYGFFLPQLYDRTRGTHKIVHSIPKGGRISPCLGLFGARGHESLTENYTYGDVRIVIIRLPISDYLKGNTSEGSIPAKYVKNSKGNLISPITSAQSVYFNGSSGNTTIKSANEVGNSIAKTVYNAYSYGTGTGSYSITFAIPSTIQNVNSKFTATNTSIQYSEPYITSSGNILGEATIGISGYYLIESSYRLDDAIGVKNDFINSVNINGTNEWLSAFRSVYKRGMYGAKYSLLKKGDKISFNFWSDTNISSLQFFVSTLTLLKIS